MSDRVVIAGAGHAAGQLIGTLRMKQFDGRITLIGEESYLPYQRPPLSKKYLAGELPAERLHFKPPAFYDDPAIHVSLDTQVASIDRKKKFVRTANGEVHHYDRLVLATGARPRRLTLPGADLPGIHYLRTIADVDGIRAQLSGTTRMTIVGAGYIGLEVAAVASTLGAEVTVIEMAERVMSRVVSPLVSAFYQREHVAHGVDLRLSANITAFRGRDRVTGVTLEQGGTVDADLVVIGVGVVPNSELAEGAGLAIDNGIVVDDSCRTAGPDIFAIGDCTQHPNEILGTRLRLESVHNALEQAKTAALNICGETAHYAQVPWFWSDQYDLKLQIAGISSGYDQTVLRGDPAQRSFACLYLREGQLIAVDAVNNGKDFMQSKALIAARATIAPALLENMENELKNLAE